MVVVVTSKHSSALFLRTDLAVLNPLVVHDFFKCSTLLRIDFEHPANDVSAFSGQQTQKAPWSFDDLRLLLSLAASYRRRAVAATSRLAFSRRMA